MNRLLRITVGLILSLVAGSVVFAQQKPKENALINFSIQTMVTGAPTTDRIYLWLKDDSDGHFAIDVAPYGAGSSVVSYTRNDTMIVPGVHHTLLFNAGTWTNGEISFNAPAGYTVYIDDVPCMTYRDAAFLGGTTTLHSLVVRPNLGFLGVGQQIPPKIGDVIWSVGMGILPDGHSAGALQIRQQEITSATFSLNSLIYSAPSSAVQITGDLSGRPDPADRRFIYVPGQALVHLNDRAGTNDYYKIEFYPWWTEVTLTSDFNYFFHDLSNNYVEPMVVYIVYKGTNGHLEIEKEGAGLSYDVGHDSGNWSITENDGFRTLTTVSVPVSGQRVETVTIKKGTTPASVVKRTYDMHYWVGGNAEELTSEAADPDGVNLVTSYTYGTTYGQPDYGKLVTVANPDGSWVKYEYSSDLARWGLLSAVYRPWLDQSPTSPAAATVSNSHAMLYSYAVENTYFANVPAGTEEKVMGTTVGKSSSTVDFSQVSATTGQKLRIETRHDYYGSGSTDYLETLTKTYSVYADRNYQSRIYAQQNADGTKMSSYRAKGRFWNYGYLQATLFDPHDMTYAVWGEGRLHGYTTAVAGSTLVTQVDGMNVDPIYLVPNRSTRDWVIFDDQGRESSIVTGVFTGMLSGSAQFEFIGFDQNSWADSKLAGVTKATGESSSSDWSDGRITRKTENDGSKTIWERNTIGWVDKKHQFGIAANGSYPAQADIYTHYSYDGAGRQLTAKVNNSSDPGQPGISVSTRTYNLAGQLLSDVNEDGLTTSYSYELGGRKVTATLPGGFTKVSENFPDGSPKSVTGNAVVHEFYAMTVNGDGTITSRKTVGDTPSSLRWTQSKKDWMGTVLLEEKPAPGGTTFTKSYTYNAMRQPVRTSETGMADTVIEYNSYFEPYRSGLRVGGAGGLVLASDDRITDTVKVLEKDGSNVWWAKTTTSVYNQSGSATPVTKSIVRQRIWPFAYATDHIQAETRAVDLFGNETVAVTKIELESTLYANDLHLTTETTQLPDSTTPQIKFTRNGRQQSAQSAQGIVSKTYYDSFGRVTKQTDPRIDPNPTPARVGYVSASNRVAWKDDSAGNRTSFGYEAATGRPFSTTDPLGKTIYQSYNTRGQVTRTWGANTYPVEYAFNDYGEQTTVSTFRGGSGWDASTWPGSSGTADTTMWAYDAATGTLTSKTDAAGKAVEYTYNSRGQLATRKWARETAARLTTTYSYSATTAEQTSIAYSDSTPGITYTYNRLGQTATVGDATGTRTFAYSATTTQLSSEILPSYFDARVLSRNYDTATTGAKGRSMGFALSGASGSGTDTSVSYGYDGYGRFNSVGSRGATFTYGYMMNANLITGITETSGWSETITYESNRDLVSSIEGKFGSATKAKFAYAHDNLGRRTSVVNTGEMFSRYANGALTTQYAYNDRSELTGAQTYNTDSTVNTSYPLAGRGYSYDFDNIGSRTSAAVIGASSGDVHATSYINNNINQVTQRTAHASTDVTGLAPTSATVTVNSAAVTRQGEYYYKNVPAGSTPAWLGFTVASSLGGSATNYSYLAATPESYTYDLDGNLTDDGRWHYGWDAENRLISMETSIAAYTVGTPRQFLTFRYDYLGRRVRKMVSIWNGAVYAPILDRKFIYDNWNLAAEYNVGSAHDDFVFCYLWGIDLSGTLQDGGGVGGLLLNCDAAANSLHLPLYDANGNVHAMINRNDGTVTAAYEYSPFGETLRATGSFAASNPFRFSTKYTDVESQMLYYGHRYYLPILGRWISRDPKDEFGSTLLLYAFVGNSPIDKWDFLGWETPPGTTGLPVFNVSVPRLPQGGSFGGGLAGGAGALAGIGGGGIAGISQTILARPTSLTESSINNWLNIRRYFGAPVTSEELLSILPPGEFNINYQSGAMSYVTNVTIAAINPQNPGIGGVNSGVGGTGGSLGGGDTVEHRAAIVVSKIDQQIKLNPSKTVMLSSDDMLALMAWDASRALALYKGKPLDEILNMMEGSDQNHQGDGDGVFRLYGGTTFDINGVVSTAGEVNYYFQGMAAAAAGWDSPAYPLIWFWNSIIRSNRGSPDQLTIRYYWAERGYYYYNEHNGITNAPVPPSPPGTVKIPTDPNAPGRS